MIFVRSASAADLAAVRDLLVETWHATYDRLYGADRVREITDAWHSIAALRRNLDAPNAELVVADDGKTISGMAFAYSEDGGKRVLLKQLYVRPEFQGQGLGSQLIAEIVESFPDVTAIRLEVEPENEAAVAFYKARSFVEVGRTENCGAEGSGIPALIFERRFS